jgi:hypothetical protein
MAISRKTEIEIVETPFKIIEYTIEGSFILLWELPGIFMTVLELWIAYYVFSFIYMVVIEGAEVASVFFKVLAIIFNLIIDGERALAQAINGVLGSLSSGFGLW